MGCELHAVGVWVVQQPCRWRLMRGAVLAQPQPEPNSVATHLEGRQCQVKLQHVPRLQL